MAALHPADQIVLLVYLIGITLLGVWAARGVRSMGDFFMPRRFGKWMLVMHAFGTGTHSDQAVGVASKTFTNGLSASGTSGCGCFAHRSTGSSLP